MRPLTIGQWQTALGVQEMLVENGVHPSIAGKLVRRAVDRAVVPGDSLGCNGKDCCGTCRGGLGIQQTRSLRRDLDPTIKPRPVISGEQCVRIAETPGNETALYSQLDDYRNRGWNVMEIEPTNGFPSVRVFWACPPGRVPMESQSQVLASQPWGAPLYANERF
jgi:hypothetical protein